MKQNVLQPITGTPLLEKENKCVQNYTSLPLLLCGSEIVFLLQKHAAKLEATRQRLQWVKDEEN